MVSVGELGPRVTRLLDRRLNMSHVAARQDVKQASAEALDSWWTAS